MPMSRSSGATTPSLSETTVASILMLPAVGVMKPASMRSVVVLPQPLGPRMDAKLPAAMDRSISSTWLENLRQSMALIGTSERCVHVADRESDIYELFCLAQDLGTRFLVRVQTNRLAAEPTGCEPKPGSHRVFAQLSAEPWVGCHCVKIGQNETARLHVKFATIETLPPKGKRKRYAPQLLTYIHALEIDPPADRAPIDWKLVTNLPVDDITAAIEKLEWYALRWKVEVFHKVMKSGCGAEKARLETADRLAKFLALIAVVSWRIFFLTMSAREKPEAEPETILTPAEIATLDSIDAARPTPRILRRTLASYLLQIAMLGGYLARKHDPPPGNMVVW